MNDTASASSLKKVRERQTGTLLRAFVLQFVLMVIVDKIILLPQVLAPDPSMTKLVELFTYRRAYFNLFLFLVFVWGICAILKRYAPSSFRYIAPSALFCQRSDTASLAD